MKRSGSDNIADILRKRAEHTTITETLGNHQPDAADEAYARG